MVQAFPVFSKREFLLKTVAICQCSVSGRAQSIIKFFLNFFSFFGNIKHAKLANVCESQKTVYISLFTYDRVKQHCKKLY
jgi:hypothetical protein